MPIASLTEIKLYIVDVGPFIAKWHMNEFPSSLYPKLDIHGAIALGASIQHGPGSSDIFNELIQSVSPEIFNILDTTNIALFLQELHEAISLQLCSSGIDFGPTLPLYLRWVGDTSLCLVIPNDRNKYSFIRTASMEAAKNYIRRTNSILDGTEYAPF